MSTKKLVNELDTKWKPIFCKMMEGPGVKPIQDDVDENIIQSSYAIATEYLKQSVSYIWLKADEEEMSKYTLGTWLRMIAHSEIELHRTPRDISRLPPVGRCIKTDQSKRDGWKI